MSNQNLENSYQVIIMNESESMSLQEESQENHFPASDSEDLFDLSEESYLPANQEELDPQSNKEDDLPPQVMRDSLHKKREGREDLSAQFEAFKKNFDEGKDLEAKLQMAIDFMEASLAQGGTPHFRSFWEARRLCLPLFKENISPGLRSQLWVKYSELSKEARRLKDILDEQSAFAVEQIEIAIQALEKEILQFDEQVEKANFLEEGAFPQVLRGHYGVYQHLQKQLNILNTEAARINALRKELLKTEMRIRHKNKFFQRLSLTGDQVFPKRKELIKQVSQQFSDDVDQFIEKYFGKKATQESLYILREEIKALQSLAKVLTLNTHSFTHTRTRLSECWDHIKAEEKERKKERAQQRVVFKQNFEEMEKQIQSLKEGIEKNEIPQAEVQKRIDTISNQIRRLELGREEVKTLRENLGEIRKGVQEKVKSEEDARQQLENERNRQKKEKYLSLKQQVEQLLKEHETQEVETLVKEREAILTEIHHSVLMKNEKQELERLLKPLRDIITDKKEKALLELSEDDRQALQQLQNILKQRKERRQEIKEQLEILRKAAGSSSLDFDKALNYKNQINEEKERLEKANHSIQEIETKIVDLQDRIKKG